MAHGFQDAAQFCPGPRGAPRRWVWVGLVAQHSLPRRCNVLLLLTRCAAAATVAARREEREEFVDPRALLLRRVRRDRVACDRPSRHDGSLRGERRIAELWRCGGYAIAWPSRTFPQAFPTRSTTGQNLCDEHEVAVPGRHARREQQHGVSPHWHVRVLPAEKAECARVCHGQARRSLLSRGLVHLDEAPEGAPRAAAATLSLHSVHGQTRGAAMFLPRACSRTAWLGGLRHRALTRSTAPLHP